MKEPPQSRSESVRTSGYLSRSEELWYGLKGPFYDWLTWWCFLPLGGESRCRQHFIDWYAVEPGHAVLSLCCGTGTTEMALAEAVGDTTIIAIDLGRGQIATARQKHPERRVDFQVGNASKTGFDDSCFDRVLVTLALHEMPRALRHAVLREAARVCRPDGRVVAIEHARPEGWGSALVRAFWWFYWIPGNPEYRTTKELQARGLSSEMEEAGLDVLCVHRTHPDWIEGVVGTPAK